MSLYERITAHLTGFRARPDRVIRHNFPKFHAKVVEEFGTFSVEYAYRLLHPKAGGCIDCETQTPFLDFKSGFAPYCGRKCALVSEGRQESRRTTCMRRYGVDHVSKLEAVKKRKRKTCRSNYGTDYPMQNRKLFEQAQITSSTAKPIELAGRTIWTRGYEDKVIRRLLYKGFSEKEIRPPHKSYRYRDEEGKVRRYHPDLLVRDSVVEVKSPYTAGLSQGTLPKAFLTLRRKAKSVINAGDDFVVIIADKHGHFLAVSQGVPSKTELKLKLKHIQ